MPKKNAASESKKAAQKKKQQIVEDKTFGLKNKNKSKKVQKQIQSIQKTVFNSGDRQQRKQEQERKQAKEAAKARRKAQKAEQEALFGEALLAVQKKSSANKVAGKIEAKGRDNVDDDSKKTTSRAMKLMYQMDAKEMDEKLKEDPNYVPTLEDEIEMERTKLIETLAAQNKKGTPVTEETFAQWQAAKRQRKELEMKKAVEAELKKKKGGKGLSVLSGRDLYQYKADLFVDDNNDDDNVTEAVDSKLFLQGDDDDLDDLLED